MSRAKKIWIVTALGLLVLGAAIGLGALLTTGFDFSRMNTMELKQTSYAVKEPFTRIRVEAAEADVRLARAETDQCEVICTQGDKITHTVAVEGDTLTVIRRDERAWYERLGVYWGDMTITVYLPETAYGSLEISTLSGEITVPAGFTFDRAEAKAVSGDIDFAAQVTGQVRLTATSGNAALADCACDTLQVQTVSGEIGLTGVSAAGPLEASATSGDIRLTGCTGGALRVRTVSGSVELDACGGESLSVQTTSGDVHLAGCVGDTLQVGTVSGDVTLDDSDGRDQVTLKTTSGNIRGTLRSGKLFQTHTTSGDMDVPNSTRDGAICDITTTSGNVRLKVTN